MKEVIEEAKQIVPEKPKKKFNRNPNNKFGKRFNMGGSGIGSAGVGRSGKKDKEESKVTKGGKS